MTEQFDNPEEWKAKMLDIGPTRETPRSIVMDTEEDRLREEIARLRQKTLELEHNLRVCRERITEHRIRADRAESYMHNADQDIHRYKVVQKHLAPRGTKQCLGGLYDVFEIKLPSSEGLCLDEKLDALISKGVDN